MSVVQQPIIPAARNIKDFESLMRTRFEHVILLNSHLAQLQSLVQMAKQHQKKVILHADLIQGLKHDEHAAQYLCQVIKPHGLISTNSTVVTLAKKRGLIAVQRIFLLDSHSLETSYRVLASSQPDYIEVLPGAMPSVIREVEERTHLPIWAGGFIRTMEDVQNALDAGAVSVTSSRRELWVDTF